MELVDEPLKGLKVVRVDRFTDDRGYFMESYNMRDFLNCGIGVNFVQDNCVMSHKDVVRGLHCQIPPYEQGKLVSCVRGSILDVAVDVREDSPTFLDHYSVELTDSNGVMLWIPRGFAHGYAVKSGISVVNYKCDEFWSSESEGGILWNDPVLDIDWGVETPIVSDKDASFEELDPVGMGWVG